MKQKREDKLRDKIRDAYGGRWNKDEIEMNIDKHLTNVMECMKYRNLVSYFNFDGLNSNSDVNCYFQMQEFTQCLINILLVMSLLFQILQKIYYVHNIE